MKQSYNQGYALKTMMYEITDFYRIDFKVCINTHEKYIEYSVTFIDDGKFNSGKSFTEGNFAAAIQYYNEQLARLEQLKAKYGEVNR